MITRLRLSSAVLVFFATSVLATAILSQPALASSRSSICELEASPARPDTLKALRERNTEKMSRYIAQHPMPGFVNMEAEVIKEQVGEIAPRALQQILGPEFKSVSSPAPSVTMDTAVNLHEEGKSIPIHLDIPWHGRRTSTTVYASLPKTIEPRGHQYLVGPEYPAVIFHLHGGGTPTATGKNAMSIAQALAGKNIPVLAPDLAGHGRATRKMEGLMSAEEQVNWILEIIRKTVHPGVKVILSGHSWGGEFAEYMYRHSDEEKYKQIEMFFVLSAPVDVSLGGDEKLKYEWDEYYERHIDEFEARIAPADFEFQKNSHYHGKISETGSYFTYGTHMDYITPPLSPERQRQLKPKIVIVGSSDGLVYVGAEKQTEIAHSNLIGRSRFLLMHDFRTWKTEKEGGKLYPTGHNIWDAQTPDGKFVVYSMMEDETLRAAGPQGMGEDTADAAAAILSDVKRQWDNNFVFRQMVASHVEYVSTPTAERTEIGKRKLEVDTYLAAISEQEAIVNAQIEAKLKEALTPLREKFGLHKSMSIERAEKEVQLPELTAKRRQELETFLAVAEKIGKELQNRTAPDEKWNEDIAAIQKKFGAALTNAGTDLENYRVEFDKMNALKGKLSKEDERKKSDLSRIHQAYRTAADARSKRFSEEKERLIGLLHKPAGITDVKSAQLELSKDRKPKSVLQDFLREASVKETTIREAAAKDLEHMTSSIPKPAGIESIAAAKAEQKETLERENYVYAPPTNPVLVEAAERVKAATERRRIIQKGNGSEPGLDALEREAKDILGRRASLAKTWTGLWKKKGMLSSVRLTAHEARVNDLLETYKGMYLEHEHLKGVWMRELRKQGRLTEANLLAPPPEMVNLRHRYQAAKLEFETQRDLIETIRWEEALAGNLVGDERAVNSAQTAARELWGSSVTSPSEDSVVARARVLEARLDEARNLESMARQDLERAQWHYSEEMRVAGERIPFTVSRIVIRDELEQDYHLLVNRLRSDTTLMSAFRALIDKWNKHLALLRVEAQSKDTGNY